MVYVISRSEIQLFCSNSGSREFHFSTLGLKDSANPRFQWRPFLNVLIVWLESVSHIADGVNETWLGGVWFRNIGTAPLCVDGGKYAFANLQAVCDRCYDRLPMLPVCYALVPTMSNY